MSQLSKHNKNKQQLRRNRKKLNKNKAVKAKAFRKPKLSASLNEWRNAISKASRRQLNSWSSTVKSLHSGRVLQAIRQQQTQTGFARQSFKSAGVSPHISTQVSLKPYRFHFEAFTWFGLRHSPTKFDTSLGVNFHWTSISVSRNSFLISSQMVVESLPIRLLTNGLSMAVVAIGSSARNKGQTFIAGKRSVLKKHNEIPKVILAKHVVQEDYKHTLKPGQELSHQFGLPLPQAITSLNRTQGIRVRIAYQQPIRGHPRFIGRLTPLELAWRKLRAAQRSNDVSFNLRSGSLWVYCPLTNNKVIIKPTVITCYDDTDQSSDSQSGAEERKLDDKDDKDRQELTRALKALSPKVIENPLATLARKELATRVKQPQLYNTGKITLYSKQYQAFYIEATPGKRVTFSLQLVKGHVSIVLPKNKWAATGIMVSL